MSGDFIVSRRYLYTYRLFLAWVDRSVAEGADVPRVRCEDQPIATTVNGGCFCGIWEGNYSEARYKCYPSNASENMILASGFQGERMGVGV